MNEEKKLSWSNDPHGDYRRMRKAESDRLWAQCQANIRKETSNNIFKALMATIIIILLVHAFIAFITVSVVLLVEGNL